MPEVELSRLDLEESKSLRRLSPRPPEHQQPGYQERYDYLSALYDCFMAPDGERLVCMGHPMLNLEPHIVRAVKRAFQKKFFSRLDMRRLDRNEQIWLRPGALSGMVEGDVFRQRMLRAQPNHCDLFRSKRVLVTQSQNNELTWIRDWVTFYVANHGCNAVLIYDNASKEYTADDIRDAISSVGGLDVTLVIDWPYKYGAIAGPSGLWDSDCGQYGVLEHAHLRFLAWAGAVLNADIDELVVTKSRASIFDLVCESKTGYLNYPGIMIENITREPIDGMGRHAQFVYLARPPEAATRKWAVVPSRCPDRAQWCVHEVTMMTPDEDISADVTHRHFKAIRMAWKYPRSAPARPGALHQLDGELAGWMKCFADGAELRGGTGDGAAAGRRLRRGLCS
jgi:hypothetical protein